MNTRNKPCACGSGKKTKHCCGNEAERAKRNQRAWAPPPPPSDDTDNAPATHPLRPRYARSALPIILAATALMNSERR